MEMQITTLGLRSYPALQKWQKLGPWCYWGL